MTVICSGNPSTFKPEFGPTAYVAPAALGALLNNVPITWAVPLAAYLGGVTYDLANFCTTDPPADPVITATDVIEFLNFANPILHHQGALRIQQMIDRWAWYQMCQCTVVTTPAQPTPPSAPSGLPVLVPPISPSPVVACQSFAHGPSATATGGANTYFVGGPTADLAGSIPIPVGASTFRAAYTRTTAGAVHHNIQFITRFFSAAGATLGGDNTTVTSATTITKTLAVPAGSAAVQVVVSDLIASPDGTDLGTVQLDIYCGGSPNQPQTPCCPPDPIATGMLTQILEYVKLLQRQIAPFAYVTGATHTALSGAGTIAIQGLLGVKVHVTTLPTPIGREGTSPTEYFDMGFLTFGTADGYPHSVRLERETQFVLPARCSAFTVLAYDLHAGVVVDITELEREP